MSSTHTPWLEQLAKHPVKSPIYVPSMSFNWVPVLFEVNNDEMNIFVVVLIVVLVEDDVIVVVLALDVVLVEDDEALLHLK